MLFVFLLPVILILYFLIEIFTKQNPIFIQTRIGLQEKPFQLIKFRTLPQVDINHQSHHLYLPDNTKLNALQRFIRKSHLDELPQLINIIKGEMAFIGPRPLLPEYLPYYTDFQKQRHNALPGLLGLSQVSGGNDLLWSHRFRYDIFYVQKKTVRLDMIIILRFFGFKQSQVFNPSTHKQELISFIDFVKQRAK